MTIPPPEPPSVRLRRIDADLAATRHTLALADREARETSARLTAVRSEHGRVSQQFDAAYRKVRELIARRDGLLRERERTLAQLRGAPVRRPVGLPPVMQPLVATAQAETSHRSIQVVLLALGGTLLAVAAVVFTIVAWGAFGIGGRSVILAAITGITVAVPFGLIRIRLEATAETVALLALVLIGMDGYAAWHVGWVPDTFGPTAYAGVVLTVIALIAACYPIVLPLRTMRPTAVVLLQPAVVLLAWPVVGSAAGWAAIALALAGANLTIRRLTGAPARGWVGGIAGTAAALGAAVSAALAIIAIAVDPRAGGVAVGVAVPIGVAMAGLLGAETLGNEAAGTVRRIARTTAAALALPLVVLGPALTWLRFAPEAWPRSVPILLVCAAAGVTLLIGGAWRAGAASAAAALATIAATVPSITTLAALLAPLGSPDLLWRARSATETAYAVTGGQTGWDNVVCAIIATGGVTLALLSLSRTAVLVATSARWPVSPFLAVPIGLGVLSFLVPPAANAPIWLAAALPVVMAGAALCAAVLRRRGQTTVSVGVLLGVGTLLGLHALVVALAEQWTTLMVLAAATAGCGTLTGLARGPVKQAYLTGIGLGALTGLLAATAKAADGRVTVVGLALTAASLVAHGIAVALRVRRPSSAVTAAVVGVAAGQVGLFQAATDVSRPVVALLGCLAAVIGFSALRVGSDAAGRLGGALRLDSLPIVGALPGMITAIAALALPAVTTLFGPLSWATSIWSGAPHDAGALMPTLASFPGTVLDPVAMLVLAVALGTIALGGRDGTVRSAALWWSALPVAALALTELAPAFRAPWPIGLAVPLVLATCAALVAASRSTVDDRTRALAAALAVPLGLSAVGWSLADRTATLMVLSAVVTVATGLTAIGRAGLPRQAAATVTAFSTGALAVAIGAAASIPLAYPMLGTAALLILPTLLPLVGRSALPSEVRRVLETSAGGAAVLALAFSIWPGSLVAGSLSVLALTLTLLGGGLGVVALRPDRRDLLPLVPVTESLALWAWLAAAHVATVEAYTLPTAVLGGAAGLLALRRKPELSSWIAIGPALAVAVIPTGVLALEEPTLGLRALLLGIGAMAVLLVGAAYRRQAPFVTGTVVLGLLIARSLAIVLPAFAEAVPAWVPLSLGGLLLLVVGATYEQRRREAVRFGSYVRHMR
jgi:hypothetical protein